VSDVDDDEEEEKDDDDDDDDDEAAEEQKAPEPASASKGLAKARCVRTQSDTFLEWGGCCDC